MASGLALDRRPHCPGHAEAFDEFHIGGAEATLALSTSSTCERRCASSTSARPAAPPDRGALGCHVAGVDLTPAFVEAARELSEMTGMAERVDFRVGSATSCRSPIALRPCHHAPCRHEHPDKAGLSARRAGSCAPAASSHYDVMSRRWRARLSAALGGDGICLHWKRRLVPSSAAPAMRRAAACICRPGQSLDRRRSGAIAPSDDLKLRGTAMADLRTDFVGIKSPNPFWLASAPPTDKAYNVVRAFEAGWGGVVWKTLGEDPPIVNVNGPRYGAIYGPDRRLARLQQHRADHRPAARGEPARDQAGEARLARPRDGRLADGALRGEELGTTSCRCVEETGADGIELNFGCPHGMSERGMGSAVGQVPEYIEMVARWCKAHTRMPVIVKLTPNITDIRYPARAAKKGGADAVSLINTINSIIGVDLDTFRPMPVDRRQGLARRLLRAGGEADRAQHGRRRSRATRRRAACRSPASAASPPGATRRSSWRSAAAPCRSAPRR